jgi:hypothetical protein
MSQLLDFTQMRQVRDRDLERIRELKEKAAPLGIHVDDLEGEARTVNMEIERIFGERLAKGGKHRITPEENDKRAALLGRLFSFWTEITQVLDHHAEYLREKAQFDAAAARPEHAEKHEQLFNRCRRCFGAALKQLKSRRISDYKAEMRAAREFATAE